MDHLTLLSFLVIIMIIQDFDVRCIVALIVYILTQLVIISRCVTGYRTRVIVIIITPVLPHVTCYQGPILI